MSERLRQVGMWMTVLVASSGLAACGGGHHKKKKATPTPTVVSSATATRSATPTETPPSTATGTASPTRSSSASPTATHTPTSTAVSSSTPTASATPTSTATGVSTATATATSSSVPSATVTATPSSSSTPTSTSTPTTTSTASETPTASPTPTATPGESCPIAADTNLGVICGTTATIAGATAHAFLGIPYAEDTGGDNRWAAPVPITTLPDKFQATQYGPICPQSMPPDTVPAPSEDCLSLNVWTPVEPGEEPLPVMVFIHGGAFIEGSSAARTYDAAYISASEHVVVASFNYRLGALGFLAGIGGLDGNYGFLDQQMALRWVRDNIAAFGGDPDQVTLFGESAGAMSVGLHLLSAPASADLFVADIMESNPLALPYKTIAESTPFGTLLAGLLKCEPADLTCLRGTTWEDVVAAQEDKTIVIPGLLSGFAGLLLWTPVVDGTIITAEPVPAAQANGLGKPTILGTNLNEGTVFVYLALDLLNQETLTAANYELLVNGLFGGTTGAEVLALYPPETDSAPVFAQLSTDYIFFCATRAVAETGDADTYAYQFNKVSNFNVWPNVPQCAAQVCHSDELPYVFNTASNIGFVFTAPEQELSLQMVGYWSSFSRPDHDPSPLGSGRPDWPPFPGENYLLLDTPITADVDPQHNCDFWDSVGYEVIKAGTLMTGVQ
ncbi:MAG: carboxylesterase family protein [bacterium]